MTLHVTMEGTTALLMHHPRLADPLEPVVQEIKKISGKRNNKTDADHMEIRRLEWHGGLYVGDNGAPCVPAANVLKCFAEAGTRHKKGKAIQQAVKCGAFNLPLIYNGPTSPDALWSSGKFANVQSIGIARSRTMRCRPSFSEWGLTFDLEVMSDIIDESMLRLVIEEAGALVGLMDGRVLGYGRFLAKVE